VTRDLIVDELLCDGFSVGDPHSKEHHYFTGSFRGFFNVPTGPHEVTARFGEKQSTWSVSVDCNGAHVKRIDWDAGGWMDDDPATEEHYKNLARSGSMLEAKALRPCPRIFWSTANRPREPHPSTGSSASCPASSG
jgi:hypothetical protein